MAVKLGGTPDFEPLGDFVSRKHTPNNVARSLASLGEGAWKTQAQMFEEGFEGITDGICKACNEQLGTLLHRCASCSVSAGTRSSFKDEQIIAEAQSVKGSRNTLFTQGIPLRGPRELPPPAHSRRVHGGDGAKEPILFTGYAASD